MPTKELDQQDIVSFRPGDQVLIIQNGREMRIKIEAFIEAFIEAISNAVKDMATKDMVDALAAAQAADEIEDAEGMAHLQDQINAMPTPPDMDVPQGAIANPNAIVTANVLGITVAVGAGVSDLRTTVANILAALRAAKIINP